MYLLQIEKGGLIKEITNPDMESAECELVEQHLFVRKGDILSGYPNYSGLPGYLLLRIFGRNAASLDCVQKTLKKLRESWRIVYQ